MADIHESLSSLKERAKKKLERDLGPLLMGALADCKTVEVMLNADGRLWQLRYSMSGFLAHLADPLLHGLDNRVVVLDGQRFVGSTLWFSHSGGWDPMDDRLNDFFQMSGFRQWVKGHAQTSVAFLLENVRERDIVVTHHLPNPRFIHPRYEGDPLNRYFLNDIGEIVEAWGASLWIHGHTHVSLDYRVGRTRVDPFGYLRYEENPDFVEHLTCPINEGER